MTMLELIESLVELLRGQELEGDGPVAVEKYRRLDRPGEPVVYVTPVAQSEEAVAIGGQFAERFAVEIRCETPWDFAEARTGDAALQVVDRLLAVLEANRTLGDATRGAIGKVTYGLRQTPAGEQVFVATIPVEYTAEKDGS